MKRLFFNAMLCATAMLFFARAASASGLPAADEISGCLSIANAASDAEPIELFANPLFEDDLSLDFFSPAETAGCDSTDIAISPDAVPGMREAGRPVIDKDSLMTTIRNGDYLDIYGNLKFRAYISSVSDISGSNVSVAVKDSSSFVVSGTTAAACERSTQTSLYAHTCDIEWKWTQNIGRVDQLKKTLSPGDYTVALTVADSAGNTDTEDWTLKAPSASILSDVMSGPGLFDPRAGSPVRIAFQSPIENLYVRLEIYDRRGTRVYSTAEYANAGYNEMTWDGVVPEGGYAGNGIYLFKLFAESYGVKTSASGKIVVYKK